LIHEYETFQIYKIINIPQVYNNKTNQDSITDSAVMKYDISHKGIAFNDKHDKYALLTEDDLHFCAKVPFCSLKRPIYSVGIAEECVTQLFIDRKSTIKKYCNKLINVNTALPYAVHLTDATWVIIASKPLRLTITCKAISQLTSTWIYVSIPFDVINVEAGCTATSEHLTLSTTINYNSDTTISDDLVGALKRSMNMSSLALWSDFTTTLVSIADVRLPKVLPTLDFVPVNALINEVKQAHDLRIKQRYNYAALFATAAILVIIIACLSLYLYCRCRKRRVYKGLRSWFKFRKSAKGTEPEIQLMGTAPSAPNSELPAFVAGPLDQSHDKATDQRGYIALYPNVK